MKNPKNQIFKKLSSLCYEDKFEYCTVQWMIKDNHIIIESNINAGTQIMLKLSSIGQ